MEKERFELPNVANTVENGTGCFQLQNAANGNENGQNRK
jgi:hypothetical protein